MDKNTLIIILLLFIITNCFNYGLFCNNQKNIKNVEKMANTDDITAQINKIYKADVESIRNLAEISKKLQEGKLSIPGNLTVEGKLFAQGDSDMKLLKASSIILAGRNILNELNQLTSKNSSLESRLNSLSNKQTNSDNTHRNGLASLTNDFNRKWNYRFPNDDEIRLKHCKLFSNHASFFVQNQIKGGTMNVLGSGFSIWR